MTIWRHSVCECHVDITGTPVHCPFGTIPECENPEMGFDQIKTNIWKCKSCNWIYVGEEAPLVCPSLEADRCTNPDGGNFIKISD